MIEFEGNSLERGVCPEPNLVSTLPVAARTVALDWTAPTFRFIDGISHFALSQKPKTRADRSISR